MRTCYGVLADRSGLASDGLRFWSSPSGEYRVVQDPEIRVDLDHTHRWCGRVVDLQRHGENLWCVAEVDDQVGPFVPVRVGAEVRHVAHDLFWSSSRIGDRDSGLALCSVSLTATPARVAARPVVFRDGPAHLAAYTSTDPFEKKLLNAAAEAQLKRHGGPIIITDQATNPATEATHARTRIETRSAELGDVSVGRRQITAIVAPYESPAVVVFKGRKVYEVFASGCFDGVLTQSRTIRLNRDHRVERVVGRAVAWDTSRPDGLVATFKVADTRDGDEVLELAAEDCLDCSVGFGSTRESWPQPDMRLVEEGFIDHVAVTSAPAYRDARVLDVRRDLAGVG